MSHNETTLLNIKEEVDKIIREELDKFANFNKPSKMNILSQCKTKVVECKNIYIQRETYFNTTCTNKQITPRFMIISNETTIGYYKELDDAKYVLNQLFNSLNRGESSYTMPEDGFSKLCFRELIEERLIEKELGLRSN